jgi:hypothetical protein
VSTLGRRLPYALRGLARRPAFALAPFSRSLGLGATTAIFSVVYPVLLKPLPYPNADELVRIRHPAPGLGQADVFASTNARGDADGRGACDLRAGAARRVRGTHEDPPRRLASRRSSRSDRRNPVSDGVATRN